MKKKLLVLTMMALFAFLPGFTPARAAQEVDDLVPESIRLLMEEKKEEIDAVNTLDFPSLLRRVWAYFQDEAAAPLRLCARLFALVLTVAALGAVKGRGDGIAEGVGAMALFIVLCRPMLALVANVEETIGLCKNFILAFVPAFCSLVAASGYPVGATAFAGLFMSGILFFSQSIASFLLPFMQVYLAFSVAGCFSGGIDLGVAAAGMAKAAKWALLFVATLFAGALTVQSYVSVSGDSLALKTGKLVVGSAVPVIGKAMSDAVGTIYAGLGVVRAGAGVAGIVALGAMFLPMLARCAFYMVGIFALAAAAGTFGLESVRTLLLRFSDGVQIYISILLLYALLLLFAIVLLIRIGGAA